MRKIRFIYILLLISFAISCDNIIDINFPTAEKQIVVNSFISNDTNIFVNLSYTKDVKDAKDYFISDAEVKLSWADTSIYLNYLDTGLYMANIKPFANQSYQLEVTKNDTVLTAETQIPDTLSINVDVKLNTGYSQYLQQEYSDVDITIHDNPNRENYYEIIFPTDSWHEDNIDFFLGGNIDMAYSNDPILLAEGYTGNFSFQKIMISDKNFDKSNVILHLKPCVNSVKHVLDDTTIYTTDFFLVVRSVSEDYYKYVKSIEQYYDNITYGGIAQTFVNKTVGVYSNINKGYGIFAGFSQKIMHEQIKEVVINKK